MSEKRERGRPSKAEAFTKKLEEVLNRPHGVGYAIIWSDEQIVEAVNEELPEADRIDKRSFERYKAGEVKDGDDILDLFMSCYKKALRIQASNLFDRLEEGTPGEWQKWAWVIERKFDSWNLRDKKVDETPRPKKLVFVRESE